MFNSLKYAKILEDSGLPRNQAEAHMQIITAVVEEDMTTKADLKEYSLEIKSEMSELRSDVKSEMNELRSEVKNFKNEIIIKLGLLITVVLPITLALLQLLQKS